MLNQHPLCRGSDHGLWSLTRPLTLAQFKHRYWPHHTVRVNEQIPFTETFI